MTLNVEELTNSPTIDVPVELKDLLEPEERRRLEDDLERIAETRRAAAIDGSTLRLH